jgi:hypothetical protein
MSNSVFLPKTANGGTIKDVLSDTSAVPGWLNAQKTAKTLQKDILNLVNLAGGKRKGSKKVSKKSSKKFIGNFEHEQMGGKKGSRKGSKKTSKKSSRKQNEDIMEGGAKKTKKTTKKSSRKQNEDIMEGGAKKTKKTTKKSSRKMSRGANPGFEAFLELKKKVALKLSVPNGPAAAKVAGAVQKEIKEKNPSMASVDVSKKAYELFESNVEKYRKML